MIQITANDVLCKNADSLRLKLLTCGHAVVDSTWQGRVKNSACSRLYFVLSGTLCINDLEISAGQCLLLPAGSSYVYGCSSHMEHVYIHLQLLGQDMLDILRSCKDPLVGTFLEQEAAACRRLLSGSDAVCCLLAQQTVLSSVIRLLEESRTDLQNREYSPQIRLAMEYIAGHLSLQLTLAQIAEISFLAPSTLTRNFRRETGMSVGQYIDEMVMFRAEQLLRQRVALRCISEELGFCDQFYLSRRFKEKYGITPSKYCKTLQI